MAKKVSLDALIPREDFEVKDAETSPTSKTSSLRVTDLEKGSFFFESLRKPDFQRESNEWDQGRVFSLIESFLNADLIPAVILWKNQAGYTFVIDGAHRLSALAAWVNNDYGDGAISKSFYDSIIPDEQKNVAEKLRVKINKEIGPYSDYQMATKFPEKVSPEIATRARLLGSLDIKIQWLDGDAKKAESSFFKINQKAAPIDKTELELLKSRNKPNGIATRAILRGGKGHKYWSSFSQDKQQAVQITAEEINDILFKPSLKTPLKTLDIPVAGQSISSQAQLLVLEFVNTVNQIQDTDSLDNDLVGDETSEVLKKCLEIARLVNSNHASSLGLHPAVYFYARNGRYKPASFNFILQLVMQLKLRKKLDDFTKVRYRLEEIILDYDDLPRQIVRKYRSAAVGAPHVVDFYMEIIKALLVKEASSEQVISEVTSTGKFSYLTLKQESFDDITATDFNSYKKSEIFINEALKNAIRCKICSGYLHTNSISIDHIARREDGGLASPSNGQVSHPYCNTGYKN